MILNLPIALYSFFIKCRKNRKIRERSKKLNLAKQQHVWWPCGIIISQYVVLNVSRLQTLFFGIARLDLV